MITFSIIKADVGGLVGHTVVHPDLIATAQAELAKAQKRGLLVDFHVTAAGDDLQLIMTHNKGDDNPEIHKMAWDTFMAATEVAKKLKLYGAGQDLLASSFSGNIRGMGPGAAEMTIEERRSETVLCFMADKTSAGSWNLPLYKMFADPFNTAGLVISDALHEGFSFEVHDVKTAKKITFNAPEDIYDLLMFIGASGRFSVKRAFSRSTGNVGAVTSTERLHDIAGRYVGKDDPVMVVRSQGEFPAVGEILEAFTIPQIVEGWMRGSHYGPLMPVSLRYNANGRFDGPPRVLCLGFQLAEGKLVGPRDMFDDVGFDIVRERAQEIAEVLRAHGPFEPHRLPLDEMEYTTMSSLMKKLGNKWQPLDTPVKTPVGRV